ncbi:hypothetical protein F5Y15DRAFT_374904 [Xylariaceae sp. FL0016]|nr:hypothetical protein F5Y15DRAFT_374904 [Xylariaceae sp. FL0016]
MPPIERDAPGDWHPRHSHSSSISALIPMWDSSDPDRAPPPLPLNPQSPGVGTSRTGTSLAIQSAHAALNEKARETALVPHLPKRMTEPSTSPERALVQRPSPHKRMQSLQPGTVRDMSLMIEGSRDSASPTPRGSPEKERTTRPSTPIRGKDFEKDPLDKENGRPSTPTPMPTSMTPTVRPSVRRPQSSILGENTPPQSATMLALQNMMPSSSRESTPLANVTNDSTGPMKNFSQHDQLSNQLLTLTNIATALQKEMSQLSRRSRDNATDLMSLKEATHARDEDIRKSLRDLASNADTTRHHKDTYTGGLYLDNKPWNTSPTQPKSRPFSLPRIPSPNSFAASIDRDSLLSTPSLVSSNEGNPASMALLEKIIREMGTKDGQDAMIAHLSELAEKLAGLASAAKVEELIGHIQTMSQEHAVIPSSGDVSNRSRNFSFDEGGEESLRELDWNARNGAMTRGVHSLIQDHEGRHASASKSRANDVLSDDVIKIIRSVKDSVAQGGGLTAEVKALVRELRGEVLGMGREIGRKLEENAVKRDGHARSGSESTSREELVKIVEEGLEQMKVYMHQRLRDHRRSSTDSAKSTVDYQEVYNALRAAINDSNAEKDQGPDLCREDVMQAVKEAFDSYKPEIHIEQLGLERDEVLVCLKEGLEEYAPRQDVSPGASRDEVFRAVVEGLKHIEFPKIDTPASLSRDEILEAVRECLEEFEFPIAPSAIGNELTRDDMLDAVKQGLSEHEFPDSNAALVPHSGADNPELMERLQDIMQYMQQEFKAVSEEAKQNVAANGRDTEQVLDATKDGFETLRAHIEEYVDKAAGVVQPSTQDNSNQEEVMANLVNSFDNFREELGELIAKVTDDSRDMLQTELAKATDNSRDVLQTEIETLRDTVNSSLVPHVPPSADHREALEALREGIERVRSELLRPHAGTTDILDALHEGFTDVQASIERMSNKPVDLTANDEILEALKSGLEGVRVDIESIRESAPQNDRAVANIGDVPAPASSDAVLPADLARTDDIKNLEVMMTQLRIKMEAMEASQPAHAPAEGGLSKDDLAELEEMLRKGVSKEDLNAVEELLRTMQESVAGLSSKEKEEGEVNPEDNATKEDTIAIETILRNTKSRLDDLIDGEQAIRKDHIDAIEALVLETKDNLGSFTEKLDEVSKKEDHDAVISLVTQVTLALDEMKERAEKSLEDPEKVTKTDIDAIEAAVLDAKTVIEQMVKADIAALPSKDDIAALPSKDDISALPSKDDISALPSKDDLKSVEDIVKEIKEKYEEAAEANKQAQEEQSKALVQHQEENTTVNEKVSEVKTFLDEFQTLVKEKLESGENGIESLGKLLEGLKETADQNATVGTDLKDMFETMKEEFQETKDATAGAKLDTDDKFKETTEALGTKIDEKIGELMTKYDEFQLVLEDRSKAGEERDVTMEAATLGTKAVAEELKVLIDTLGSSVTESLEKMEEASKTVFEKVEVLYAKAEDNHSDDKNEHATTRDQVKAAITTIEGLRGHVVEYQPQILESVKDVLLIVGEHFEHSKTSVAEIIGDIQKKIEEAKPEELPALPPIEDWKYDDAAVHEKLDKLDSEVGSKLDTLSTGVHEKLDRLDTLDKLDSDVSDVHTKLDTFGTEVHPKLDRLVEHTEAADKAYAQLDTLDAVHAQVKATAAEISEFLGSQKQRIDDEHEDREKTLQETTMALERQRAEQSHVEANLVYLREEEEKLRESIIALRSEQEALQKSKVRLHKDLGSLETALEIRREELHEMDVRAEGLERRILEGVLDHSRALLVAKTGARSVGVGKDAMSRKRVPGARSSLGPGDNIANVGVEPAKEKKSAKPRAVNMAMQHGKRSSLLPPAQQGASRRILSLSQINSNVPAGGLKRSQSVRTGTVRKSSWAPGRGAAMKGYGDLDGEDKENNNGERALATIDDAPTPGEGIGEEEEDAPTPTPAPQSDDGEEDGQADREESPEMLEPPTPTDSELDQIIVEEDNATELTDDINVTDSEVSASTDASADSAASMDEADEEPEGEEGEEDSEVGTLRRSSMGTTVITSTETEGGYSGYTDDRDDDDARSEWTESHVGRSNDSFVSESIADTDSIAGEGEVVVYAG